MVNSIIRAAALVAVLAAASGTHATTVLLTTERSVPPFHVASECLGLKAFDSHSGALLRDYPALGCIGNVTPAGPGRAFGLRIDGAPSARVPVLLHVDLRRGTELARLELGSPLQGDPLWLRRIDEREVLVALQQSVERGSSTLQLLRAGLDDGHWVLRGQRVVKGVPVLSNRGDQIAFAAPDGDHYGVDILRLSDLGLVRHVAVNTPSDALPLAAAVIGTTLYLFSDSFGGLAHRVDPETGAALGETAFQGSPRRMVFDSKGRLLGGRSQSLSGNTYEQELIARDIVSGEVTTLASRTGPFLAYSIGVLGDEVVAVEYQGKACFTGYCGASTPLTFFNVDRGLLIPHVSDPMSADDLPIEFLAPDLDAPDGVQGGPALETIPTLGTAGQGLLALLLLAAATAGASRVGRRRPPIGM